MKRYTVFTSIVIERGIKRTFEVRAENIDDAWKKAESSNLITANDGKVENVMLHNNESPSRIHISNAIDLTGDFKYRKVCPDCAEHQQGAPDETHDCKVVFFDDDKKSIGQCLCYSKEHGLRGD